MKISAIVPVYNTAKYLKECIDSILNQTLQGVEIIIVDDGSDDGSWEVIQEYAAKHDKISVFRQQRKRQGAARNVALKHAKGEFVTFVDSDDILPNDSYEKLYDIGEQFKSDVVVGVIQSFDESNEWVAVPVHLNKFEKTKINFSIQQIPEILEDISACNKIVRRTFINSHHISFPEKCTGEDLDFMAKIYLKTPNISIIPDVVYKYRNHNYSTTSLITPYFFNGRVQITKDLEKLFTKDNFLMNIDFY